MRTWSIAKPRRGLNIVLFWSTWNTLDEFSDAQKGQRAINMRYELTSSPSTIRRPYLRSGKTSQVLRRGSKRFMIKQHFLERVFESCGLHGVLVLLMIESNLCISIKQSKTWLNEVSAHVSSNAPKKTKFRLHRSC